MQKIRWEEENNCDGDGDVHHKPFRCLESASIKTNCFVLREEVELKV